MKRITIICKAAFNPVTEATELLGRHDINIQDIDFNQFGEDAFLRIAVSDYDTSLSLLINGGFKAVSDDIVLVRGEDRPFPGRPERGDAPLPGRRPDERGELT